MLGSGGFYAGMWKEGFLDGEGIYELPDSGTTYKGTFKNSLESGHGTKTIISLISGTIEYTGHFLSGHFHGRGCLKEIDL